MKRQDPDRPQAKQEGRRRRMSGERMIAILIATIRLHDRLIGGNLSESERHLYGGQTERGYVGSRERIRGAAYPKILENALKEQEGNYVVVTE